MSMDLDCMYFTQHANGRCALVLFPSFHASVGPTYRALRIPLRIFREALPIFGLENTISRFASGGGDRSSCHP